MRAALINPSFSHIYGPYRAAARVAATPQMPLGITYLAGALRAAGHEVYIRDCEVQGYPDPRALVDDIVTLAPDIVALTATTPLFHDANAILGDMKSRKIELLTVLGGVHVSALMERVYEEGCAADVCVFGEGEETLSEIVATWAAGRPLAGIPGTLVPAPGGAVYRGPPRAPADIDRIPLPARDLLQAHRYVWSVPGRGFRRVTSLITHRGCPFNCAFCSVSRVFPRDVRFRSVAGVVEEIRHIVEDLGIRHIMIQDDNLTLNRQRTEALCRALIERRFDMTFEGYTRANLVDEELLRLLQRAGLVRLSFGVESGDPEILKAIKKGVALDDYRKAYSLCKDMGIETRCSFMLGHPYETRMTIKKTIEFVNSLDVYQAYINISTPYPGSELFEMALNGVGGLTLLTEDWEMYRRYGTPVITVNDLSETDLRRYQRIAYLRFYLRPKTIWYNLRRAGAKAALVNAWAFLRSALQRG
ncbi:radical SAM protein [Candidatus Fermentibacteria bacterium]|nr:radical SAM protein [Candidatus Fermentibacteria bacterium]